MEIKKVIFDSENEKKTLFCQVTYVKKKWFKKSEFTDLFKLEYSGSSYYPIAYNCRTNESNYELDELMILSKQKQVLL